MGYGYLIEKPYATVQDKTVGTLVSGTTWPISDRKIESRKAEKKKLRIVDVISRCFTLLKDCTALTRVLPPLSCGMRVSHNFPSNVAFGGSMIQTGLFVFRSRLMMSRIPYKWQTPSEHETGEDIKAKKHTKEVVEQVIAAHKLKLEAREKLIRQRAEKRNAIKDIPTTEHQTISTETAQV